MVCVGCRRAGEVLCSACAGCLLPAPVRMIESGLVVQPAYVHTGLARQIVHDLKYRALVGAAAALAPALVEALPAHTSVLVPVPRSIARRLQLGVDPALELALVAGRLAGLPVARLLRPPWWQSRHAGKGRAGRAPVRFSARRVGCAGTVVVDDVLTTGSTLAAAARSLGSGVIGAVTATGAGV